MHWFREDLRKVLLVYVSPEWAKGRGAKFSAKEYVDSLESAHVRCIQPYAKDHHGYCYFTCSLGRPYPTDLVGELIREARPRGIKTIAYFSVGFDDYALGLHPEWLFVDSHGQPQAMPTGPFHWACLNSPYRDFCLQQIQELVSNYEIDGVWLDILPFGALSSTGLDIDGRPGLASVLDAPCYCPTCQGLYRQRYGMDLPLNPSQADRIRGFQLRVDGARSFVHEVSRITKARHPHALVTFNGAGSPLDAIDYSDLTSMEAHAPDYMRIGFRSRWARHRGRMVEIYTPLGLPGSGVGFNAWDLKPAEMLELETAIVLSQGGVLWLSQQPYPDGSADQAQYDTFKRVFTLVQKLEPYVRDTESVVDVALLMTNRPYSAPVYGQESVLATEAMHQALVHGHFQFDIVRLPADLSKYRVLVLAEQTVMSDEDAEAIRRFVHDGGCLFATGGTSTIDEAGRSRSDFALVDVFGASVKRRSQHPFVYLRLADERIRDGIPAMPILVQMPSLEVEPTTGHALAYLEYPEVKRTDVLTVLWGYPPPDEAQRHPAIILNHYNRGLCIYSAVGFPHRANAWADLIRRGRRAAMSSGGNALDVIWTERLARNIVGLLLPRPVMDTDAPPGVEVTLNRRQDGYLVHVMNHYAGDPTNPSCVGERLVVRNTSVRLNTDRLGALSRACALPSREDVVTRTSGRCLEIVLPDFDVHCLLHVE